MKINWNTKYTTISVYVVITFAACLIVYAVLFNFTGLGDFINRFLSMVAPLVWGLVIAYILNPIMKWIEKKVALLTEKNKPHPKIKRIISLSLSMILFLTALIALGSIIMPQVFSSITSIIENLNTYINNFEAWTDSMLVKYPGVLKQFNDQLDNIEKTIMEFINNFVPKFGDIMKKITNSTLSFIVAIKDFLIGIIVAVYFLYGKEHFQAQFKKIFAAILPNRAANTFFRIGAKINDSISAFVSGKIVDSIIIGLLCFICMTVFRFDFAVLISVIVGATNVIPFFGPLIGAIPSALLLLVSTPKQVIPFLILLLIIQQLDGNIIGPKILGQSTGMSAFWILFAILVGGGLFGFGGMVLGVPVFTVLYSLLNEFINYRLTGKDMSTDTKDYAPAPYIDTADKNAAPKNNIFPKLKTKKKGGD